MVATATSAASGTILQRDRIIGALMSRLLPLYLYLQSLLVPGPGAAVRVELLLQRRPQHSRAEGGAGGWAQQERPVAGRQDQLRGNILHLQSAYMGRVDNQYCQVWNINILTRVCRELTRLSRSKHTLVNILTTG